jgi:hypothetical protein
MNTVTEITAALAKLEALMSEKGVKAPRADLTIRSQQQKSYLWTEAQMGTKPFDDERCKGFYGMEPSEAFAAAWAYINAMPDPATAERQKWHKDLADVIDRGHAMALPDEVMQPLRQGSQAMTENLLTHEASE